MQWKLLKGVYLIPIAMGVLIYSAEATRAQHSRSAMMVVAPLLQTTVL